MINTSGTNPPPESGFLDAGSIRLHPSREGISGRVILTARKVPSLEGQWSGLPDLSATMTKRLKK